MRDKHLLGPFEGFLRSSRLFWPLSMGPSIARGQIGCKPEGAQKENQEADIILLVFSRRAILVAPPGFLLVYMCISFLGYS